MKDKLVKIHCRDCDGSGLVTYDGLTTKGTAVVCPTCSGNGYIEATYTPFAKRKKLKGIKKIFLSAFGCPLYVKGTEEYELAGGEKVKINFDELECSYEDWLSGNKKPILIKEFSCPFIATNQSVETVGLMNCDKYGDAHTPIGNWSCYKNRAECWKKLEEAQKEKGIETY